MKTKEQIDQEYSIHAAAYGDKLFKISMAQEELKAHFKKMAELNQEAAKLAEEELKAKEVV